MKKLFFHPKIDFYCFLVGVAYSDSLKRNTTILRCAAVVPDHSPTRCRTFGPGPGLIIGATNCNSFWRVWDVRSVWATCGGFRTTVTRAAEVSDFSINQFANPPCRRKPEINDLCTHYNRSQ